jgi:hypothetical protein
MILAGRDAVSFFIPNAVFLRDCLRDGHLPLWIPYPRLGQPFLAALQTMVLYPVHLLSLLLAGPYRGFTLQTILHALIAAAGTFWAARRLGASLRGAGLAGAAFPLSPLFATLSPQANLIGAMAWSGWIVGSAVSFARRPSTATAAPLAFFVALSFTAGSPETLLWQLLLALLASFMAGGIRGAAALPLPLAWGAGLAGALLLPALEYLPRAVQIAESSRMQWSASPIQLAALGLPYADMPRGEYWGADQHFIPILFCGSLVVLLAACGALLRRRSLPIAGGGCLFALLALGTHSAPSALLLSLPPLSLFRYPAKYLTGVAFCLVILAAFGLDRAVALARRSPASPLRGALALLAALAIPIVTTFLLPLPRGIREGVWAGLPWLVLVVGLAVALSFGIPRRPGRWGILASCLTLVALAELLIFPLFWDWREFWKPLAAIDRPSLLATYLVEGEPTGRISIPLYNMELKETTLSRDLLLPNRFIEERLFALDGYGVPIPALSERLLSGRTRPVSDLLGVSWYIRQKAKTLEIPLLPYPDLAFIPTAEALPALFRSSTPFPRAFVVHRALVTDDATALTGVRDLDQASRRTVWLADGEPVDLTPEEPSLSRILRYEPNLVEVEILASARGYLVLADMFYPGWRAEVDGRPAPLHRADVALRAVPVAAGHHVVRFLYRPWTATAGVFLSVISLLPLGILALRRWRRR